MTPQPTDTQLKQALAKMLPENTISLAFAPELYWLNAARHETNKVLDTELLYLCWLVEETFSEDDEWAKYSVELGNLGVYGSWAKIHASWQQRVIALAKVKNMEIV